MKKYIQGDSRGICATLGNDRVILSKNVHTNMGPILNGYGVMGIFHSRTRRHVNRAYG
jgi:hypothetical protein